MVRDLGPRARRVYADLRAQIDDGSFAPGAKLPSYPDLAVRYGVAPMTVRQALARLEAENLVTLEVGRGTFVRQRTAPALLIVDDDPISRKLLRLHVQQAGYEAVEAAGPGEALDAVQRNADIALVLSDLRMPDAASGIGFMRTVARRWPDLPLVAITAYPDDLAELYGTPDYPVLVLAKPIHGSQIQRLFRFVRVPPARSGAVIGSAAGGGANRPASTLDGQDDVSAETT